MVSVNVNLFFFLTFLFSASSIFFVWKKNLTVYDFLIKKSFLNVFFFYVVIFLLATSLLNWYILLALYFVFFVSQQLTLTISFDLAFTHLISKLRKQTYARLILDNWTITFDNIIFYTRTILKSEYMGFVELISSFFGDFLLLLSKTPLVKPLTLTKKFLELVEEKVFSKKRVRKLSTIPMKEHPYIKKRLPLFLKVNYTTYPEFTSTISHILVFYNFFKTTIVALLITGVYFLYTIFFFKIQFLKQLSVWFIIGMLYFWLMSGFNFFIKRYQYGKFTSQIQRFWKRTNTCFWLIEGFLILLFFYYFLNSSQEPVYMYDYSSLNQEYLISLHTAGTNVVLLSVVIYFMYFTLLRIQSNNWTQLNLYLLIISIFIFYSFFIETYQFFYVISTFNERLWVFNEEENLWSIEIDNPILRTKQHYLLVCLIAKYWHFLFIFLSWVFFLIKSFEKRKVTYVLFGANLQNIIILYVLNFACYLQWFKWVYRRFFDLPYTWFMTNLDNKFVYRLIFEMKLFLVNSLSLNTNVFSFKNVIYKSLTIWNVDSLALWKFI